MPFQQAGRPGQRRRRPSSIRCTPYPVRGSPFPRSNTLPRHASNRAEGFAHPVGRFKQPSSRDREPDRWIAASEKSRKSRSERRRHGSRFRSARNERLRAGSASRFGANFREGGTDELPFRSPGLGGDLRREPIRNGGPPLAGTESTALEAGGSVRSSDDATFVSNGRALREPILSRRATSRALRQPFSFYRAKWSPRAPSLGPSSRFRLERCGLPRNVAESRAAAGGVARAVVQIQASSDATSQETSPRAVPRRVARVVIALGGAVTSRRHRTIGQSDNRTVGRSDELGGVWRGYCVDKRGYCVDKRG